jgi:hypothetical protein
VLSAYGDVRFIYELYKDKPSTQRVEPQIIEAVHVPEEEYDSDTIVLHSRQNSGKQHLQLPLKISRFNNYFHPRLLLRALLILAELPPLNERDRSPSPNLVKQQILQELSTLRTSPHTTPRG